MTFKTINGHQYSLNIAPISFADSTVQVGVLKFVDSDQLKKLRKDFSKTHLFVRKRNEIICVPLTSDAEVIGDSFKKANLSRELALSKNLIRNSLIDYFYSLGRPLTDYEPISFLAEGKDNSLLVRSEERR